MTPRLCRGLPVLRHHQVAGSNPGVGSRAAFLDRGLAHSPAPTPISHGVAWSDQVRMVLRLELAAHVGRDLPRAPRDEVEAEVDHRRDAYEFSPVQVERPVPSVGRLPTDVALSNSRGPRCGYDTHGREVVSRNRHDVRELRHVQLAGWLLPSGCAELPASHDRCVGRSRSQGGPGADRRAAGKTRVKPSKGNRRGTDPATTKPDVESDGLTSVASANRSAF